jgi:hypothetical protein
MYTKLILPKRNSSLSVVDSGIGTLSIQWSNTAKPILEHKIIISYIIWWIKILKLIYGSITEYFIMYKYKGIFIYKHILQKQMNPLRKLIILKSYLCKVNRKNVPL